MKNSIILIFVIQLSSFGFGQTKDEKITQLQIQVHLQNEKIDSLKLIIDDLIMTSVEPVQEKSPLINWFYENFGMIVPPEMSLNCEFICNNYKGKLDEAILKEMREEWWLGSFNVNNIVSTQYGFIIDLGTDALSKTMIITENYITVSYHGIIGSDGQSLIYSFEKNSVSLDSESYCFNIIAPAVLIVGRDYYDNTDIEDPNYRGHIFEYGAFNLDTQEYTFIAND